MSTLTVQQAPNEILPPEFERLFREHSQLVYRTACRVTGNAEDAEDILQTIFVRLLGREFPRNLRQNPRAYLYRAAVNVSLDTIQKKRHLSVVDVEHLAAESPRPPTSEDMEQRLYAAIARLRPAAAEILILRYMHNYSDAAIAKMLGKSRGVIAVSLVRTRARLRKLIEQSIGETCAKPRPTK